MLDGAVVVPGGGASGYPVVGCVTGVAGVTPATEVPPEPLHAVAQSATTDARTGNASVFMMMVVVLRQ